ncbi:hypothetical protein TDB9533_03767 [Thalassocella blandensis]|nr:hypothetical protein TDB9533_03767 [Thalassocella blandensis]
MAYKSMNKKVLQRSVYISIAFIQMLLVLMMTSCSVSPKVHDTATEQDALTTLMDDYWQHVLEYSPVFATTLGVRTYDDHLGSLSIESMDGFVVTLKQLRERLAAIDTQHLSSTNKVNAQFLQLKLDNEIEEASYNGRFMLFTNRWGWHIEFSGLPQALPFFTLHDYQSYIARLQDYPRYNQEGIATLRQSIALGYTQPCKAMTGFEKTINTHIVKDAAGSVFYAPFERKPEAIDETTFLALKQDAASAIEQYVIPAYQHFYDFYTQEYLPQCYRGDGLFGLEKAHEYYDFLVRKHTTMNISAEDVHRVGMEEVVRIRQAMERVIKQSGFSGTREAFVKFLREDPQFYPENAEAHLRHAAYIAKKADGELPKLFGKLPRMPYTVKAVPEDIAEKTTTAYYEPLAGDGSRAGVYRVNTSLLHTRPSFEMEALTLHEAVPGHHLQIALAYEQEDLPDFRRYSGNVTAFIEGWGLYAESLGEEMGFYQNTYTRFGQLSYEMWRACRLVVDTGLHAKGWTREQAIQFMADNTALSLHNIESEVDRYMTWPGQALGYKMGELHIKALREHAQQTLGQKFDIREFHDIVLQQGSVPMNILEQYVNTWIEMKGRSKL